MAKPNYSFEKRQRDQTMKKKKEAKETVAQKLEEDMKSGRFRRSKIIPLLWDLPNQTVYCSAAGANFEKLPNFKRSSIRRSSA